LQSHADLERVQVHGLCTCTSSRDAYQAISIKAEVPSDAEVEGVPIAITFPGEIKAEPEVNYVSMSTLGRFHKHKYPSFYRHSIYALLLHRTTFIRKN
jgi:hypothetical protein